MITDEFQKLPKAIPLMSAKEMNEKWALIGKGKKFSEKLREMSLNTPTLRVCHRILALNFFGKRDSGNTISANELYIMWAMETKLKLNFGSLKAGQLKQILTKPSQRMSLAYLPTFIAKERRGIKDFSHLTCEKLGVLDLACLNRIYKLAKGKDGMYNMIEETSKPPARETRASAKSIPSSSRRASSGTSEPTDNPEAAMAKLQMTVNEIQQALYAYFEHVRFRYPPGSP